MSEHMKCRQLTAIGLPLLLLLLLQSVSRPISVQALKPGGGGSLKVVYAVNAGGREHTDKNGIHFEADPNKIGTASDYGNHLMIIGRVPAEDEVLYRTERYHTSTFGYDLPIDGDGEYALIMKFCEVYFNSPNMKVFDVVLNNQHIIISELDIFHQVGRGTAHEEYAFFTVADGRLHYKDEESQVRNGFVRLEFIKGYFDNPKINAFALLKGDVEHIPRLSPISDDILPMDADMAVFHDRVSADSSIPPHASSLPTPPSPGQAAAVGRKGGAAEQRSNPPPSSSLLLDIDDEVLPPSPPVEPSLKTRKTSGPRQPNPYVVDDSSVMLPVFIAIGAFIPLLFCLCKL